MDIVNQCLGAVRLGDATSHRNLEMHPLFGPALAEPGYLTLDQALAAGRTRITEVSAGGSVPELRLVNEANLPVFLLDGEELVGAKQNRVLNLSILAPAGKTITVPVSCVEAGRWSHVSPQFASAPRTQYARGRASKMADVSNCLSEVGARHSDQHRVWQDIDAKAARMQASSPTHAMEGIYARHAVSVEEYVAAFRPLDGQTGALFAIDGAVVGLDLFDSPSTLSALLAKLLRSYALDALETSGTSGRTDSREAAARLLADVARTEARAYPAVGEGEDVRLAGEGLVGGALTAWDRVVHLSAFRLPERPDVPTAYHTRAMQRASARREGRTR